MDGKGLTVTKIFAGLSRISAVINKGNLVPRAFHVLPLFGKKGNGNELLYVEITKKSIFGLQEFYT